MEHHPQLYLFCYKASVFFGLFFSSIGVDATSEGNQTNLSFSAREHLPWCTLKALQTPRCYTGACYKFWPQGTSGSPGWNGPFAPSLLPDPRSFSRLNETTHLHSWLGRVEPSKIKVSDTLLATFSEAVKRQPGCFNISVFGGFTGKKCTGTSTLIGWFHFFPLWCFIGHIFFCGKQVSLYL